MVTQKNTRVFCRAVGDKAYRKVSRGVVMKVVQEVVVLSGLSSGVWSELARVFIEFKVSDIDMNTLSKTELGSESSVTRRCLHEESP